MRRWLSAGDARVERTNAHAIAQNLDHDALAAEAVHGGVRSLRTGLLAWLRWCKGEQLLLERVDVLFA